MKIDRALRERISAEDSSGNVPSLISKRSVAEQRNEPFEKSSEAVREDTDRPPHQMASAFGQISPTDIDQKVDRKQGRQDRQIVHRANAAENLVHSVDCNEIPRSRRG